jgi:hypothetical protein
MSTSQIILLALLETVGIILAVRLWLKRPKLSVARRIGFSLLVLIPVLGPLTYGFVALDPSAHGEDVGDYSSGGGAIDPGHQP